MHYLLFYDVVGDYVTRRVPFRADHLTFAQPYVERGELLLGGALADPVDGAVLLFDAASPALVERFARGDPYIREGLVTRWRVRAWTTVAGPLAATPIAPGSLATPGAPGG
ncbi:MAG: YciI family protein [Gemmatimonadales bacterium]|nr:YciI family protein [Gemmatimonadales bacterium]